MDPTKGLNIFIPGEEGPAEASSIWGDQEQRALAVALATEFERWAAHKAIAEASAGNPVESWAEQFPPPRSEPAFETRAVEATDPSASVSIPDFATTNAQSQQPGCEAVVAR